MLEILLSNAVTIAFTLSVFVIPLVEVFKRAGLVKRWIPVFSVLIGMFVSWVASSYILDADLALVLFSGAISGFISSGLWDFGKKSLLGK